MKIIGKTKAGFIIDISNTELEKIFNSYYGEKIKELKNRRVSELEVNEEIDCALIYNFNQELESTVESMIQAYSKFKSSSDLLMKFCEIVNKLPKSLEKEPA